MQKQILLHNNNASKYAIYREDFCFIYLVHLTGRLAGRGLNVGNSLHFC